MEIDKKKFKKSAVGYCSKEVDKFIANVLTDYEKIYKENIELQDKITVLNEGIQYYKTMEKTLQDTLISAEKAATEVKSASHKKAELIEREAEIRAKDILDEAKDKLFSLNQQISDLQKQYETTKNEMKRILSYQLDHLEQESKHLISMNMEEKRVALEDQRKNGNITMLK